MSKLHDHKVAFRDRASIAKLALWLWKQAAAFTSAFDICAFIEGPLSEYLKNKGPLRIRLHSERGLPEGAYVEFNPLTLHVTKKIWEDAKKGLDYARYILAHEIGHLVLHDKRAQAFSRDKSVSLKFVLDEQSCETQAHWFAEYFLVPDHLVNLYKIAELIETACVVPKEIAEKRVKDFNSTNKLLKIFYENDICLNCGNLSVHNGCECTVCGKQPPLMKG